MCKCMITHKKCVNAVYSMNCTAVGGWAFEFEVWVGFVREEVVEYLHASLDPHTHTCVKPK